MTNKETKIALEISNFCARECGRLENCAEYDCILYRIERLVFDDEKSKGVRK